MVFKKIGKIFRVSATAVLRLLTELCQTCVFDSFRQQTSIGLNFCVRTPFLTCEHSKCSAQKVLSSLVVRPLERSEFPKESGKVDFLPSEVLDPEFPADLHLYLALELFLSACCATP